MRSGSGLRQGWAALLAGVVVCGGAMVASTPAAAGQAAAVPAPAAAPVSDWERQHQIQLREDWPWLARFHDADLAVPAPNPAVPRVVFMGDSITEGWTHAGVPPTPADPKKDWINRGIGGQTTPQMVLRFRQDVIDLKPQVVVILAGINDIAANTGEMTLEASEANLADMADLAHANGIRVVMCSVMPAYDFPWKPGRQPAEKVKELNKWMKAYAAEKGYVYVDYWTAMADERGGLPANLSKDGVHPTAAGYAIMMPLVEAGIAQALAR